MILITSHDDAPDGFLLRLMTTRREVYIEVTGRCHNILIE